MGELIGAYRVGELSRISMPGAAVPSLFWAIPVGNWEPNELRETWQWFTLSKSMCNELGLLLAKGMRRDGRESGELDLSEVGGKLLDLMPGGVGQFVAPRIYREGAPQVLLLSGGYPQPGWGVLTRWQGIHQFEELIQKTSTRLVEAEPADRLDVFRQAARAFHSWQDVLKEKPAHANAQTVSTEVAIAENAARFLTKTAAKLQQENSSRLCREAVDVLSKFCWIEWLNYPQESCAPLIDSLQSLARAMDMLKVPTESFTKIILPKLEAALADSARKESAFRELGGKEEKNALKACLYLREEGGVAAKEDLRVWAQRTLDENKPKLFANLDKLGRDVASRCSNRATELRQREQEVQRLLAEWGRSYEGAHQAYRVAANKVAEIQWEMGPRFLATLEQISRCNGCQPTSIPWDPARMIGWKIMVSRKVTLAHQDLYIAARELAPGANEVAPASRDVAAPAVDGSFFTDYVHHIAISRPGFSPRAVTRDLLVRLLRPTEMMILIEEQTGSPSHATEASRLAEELLQSFGWWASDEVCEKPLAGCIQPRSKNGGPVVVGNLDGNDLRNVLESLCKDMVDTIVARIGYNHDRVWAAVESEIPAYKPRSIKRDWGEEVQRMTVGSAGMIIRAFGPLAFPEQRPLINDFVETLVELKNGLNPANHHPPPPLPADVPVLIDRLIKTAEGFLGELPWHMDVSVVYGQQPKIISGEAWSHGCAAPRLLKVIVWTGEAPGGRVTIWNKTRLNPVVPDPVFIMRPRKR